MISTKPKYEVILKWRYVSIEELKELASKFEEISKYNFYMVSAHKGKKVLIINTTFPKNNNNTVYHKIIEFISKNNLPKNTRKYIGKIDSIIYKGKQIKITKQWIEDIKNTLIYLLKPTMNPKVENLPSKFKNGVIIQNKGGWFDKSTKVISI